MFFPARAKSIPTNAKVLEIGPSVKPHSRATAWLDKRFRSEDDQRAQRCSPLRRDSGFENRITYYEDDRFPFEDNASDYVICSHVIEHIPRAALAIFISEMQRVAPRGYIEVPLFLYELVFPQEVHLWHISHQNNTLLLAPKQADPDEAWSLTGTLAKALGAQYLFDVPRYRPLFFHGFEWQGTISYEVLDRLPSRSAYHAECADLLHVLGRNPSVTLWKLQCCFWRLREKLVRSLHN